MELACLTTKYTLLLDTHLCSFHKYLVSMDHSQQTFQAQRRARWAKSRSFMSLYPNEKKRIANSLWQGRSEGEVTRPRVEEGKEHGDAAVTRLAVHGRLRLWKHLKDIGTSRLKVKLD